MLTTEYRVSTAQAFMDAVDAINKSGAGNYTIVAYTVDGKRRNSPAGPSVNMDSRVAGRAGGWE